jgi:hypothetical protein
MVCATVEEAKRQREAVEADAAARDETHLALQVATCLLSEADNAMQEAHEASQELK